jgi:hypothetical protein
MTIEELEPDFKNMAYLTAEETDQKAGMKIVEKLYADLLAADFGLDSDPKILDIKKFSDVPKEYIEGKPLDKVTSTTSTVSGVGAFAAPGTRYVGLAGTYNRTQPKADPEPAVIGRTQNKKPAKAALDLMEEKIDQIMAGTFEPDLPETMGEDVDGTAVAGEPDEETYYNNYGSCGFC